MIWRILELIFTIFKDRFLIFWTAVMAIAIVITAFLAFREIQIRKEIKKKEYILQRVLLCKQICYEINQNELSLECLKNFFLKDIKNFSEIQNHFKERKYEKLFQSINFNKYIKGDMDFDNDEIFENLYSLYSNLRNMESIASENYLKEKRDLEFYLNHFRKKIKECLNKTEYLYKLFKDNIEYDHKESSYYKELKEFIDTFCDLK